MIFQNLHQNNVILVDWIYSTLLQQCLLIVSYIQMESLVFDQNVFIAIKLSTNVNLLGPTITPPSIRPWIGYLLAWLFLFHKECYFLLRIIKKNILKLPNLKENVWKFKSLAIIIANSQRLTWLETNTLTYDGVKFMKLLFF